MDETGRRVDDGNEPHRRRRQGHGIRVLADPAARYGHLLCCETFRPSRSIVQADSAFRTRGLLREYNTRFSAADYLPASARWINDSTNRRKDKRNRTRHRFSDEASVMSLGDGASIRNWLPHGCAAYLFGRTACIR